MTAPQPREQRVLKLFILLMMPVMTLAGFGGFANWGRLRFQFDVGRQ